MEHTILDYAMNKLIVKTEEGKPTMIAAYTHNQSVQLNLKPEQELALVKALLPKILERGDLDASINTWIEQNMLDGDPMDDCGGCVAHMKPNDMYELVYDCVNDIMEN